MSKLMKSRVRKSRGAPPLAGAERVLSVATAEFSASGFAGARVERIARKARLSKGMIYYLFRSKRMLYQQVVRRIYTSLHERFEPIRASDLTSPQKLERLIAEVEEFYHQNHAYLSILLRESVEGGQNLDAETLKALVPARRCVFEILQRGIDDGSFRVVPPLFAYYAILSPIMLFLVAAPFRNELSNLRLPTATDLSPSMFVRHFKEAMAIAFAAPREATAAERGPRSADYEHSTV